jgi:hypothetical protein
MSGAEVLAVFFSDHDLRDLFWNSQVHSDRPWLLVFDGPNAIDPDPLLLEFIADGRQRDVILTTARQATRSRGIQIPIPPFAEEDAGQFILHQSLVSSSPGQLNAAKEIARKMGRLPLKLHITRSEMQRKGLTPRQFLALLDRRERRKESDSTDGVDSAYHAGLEELKNDDDRLADLLFQLSFMAAPAEFLFKDRFLVAQLRGETLPSFYGLFIEDREWSSQLFFYAVTRIGLYGLTEIELVGESGARGLQMHTVVKHWAQRKVISAEPYLGPRIMLRTTATVAASLSANDWEII